MHDLPLVRHFLQRFLENDLISPNADRHEILAVACAALVSLGLFVTVLLSLKYLFAPFQSPGRTAILALDDRFLYIAWSMIVMALVAVATWGALSLDERDTAILGPLPIPRRVLVRAKLVAVVMFASGFALALNVVPSILHPTLMVAKLRIGMLTVLALIMAHAGVTLAAAAFGFLLILGARELLYAALGPAAFNRISTIVRTCLVVLFVTAFLLLPGLSWDAARWWPTPRAPSPYAVPPLWFLGLHEALAGDLIDGLPRGLLPSRILESENEATALYRSHRFVVQDLGKAAMGALGLVIVVSMAAFAWNNRRLPVPPAARARRGTLSVTAARLARSLFLVRHPVAQAGFFFTLQSLSRSVPHRVSLAMWLAVGLATATVSLRGLDVGQAADVSSTPLALFAVQTVLVAVLLAGFRHAVRVPAELRASWTFQLSWSGDERPYFTGVKRAAVAALGLPILLILFPLHALALGQGLALAHLASGLLLVLVLLEGLFLGFRKLPFACGYVPDPRLKTVAPIYVVAFLLITFGLAWLERLALTNTHIMAAWFAVLMALLASLRAGDVLQRRPGRVIEFDELPEPATQRLNLSG